MNSIVLISPVSACVILILGVSSAIEDRYYLPENRSDAVDETYSQAKN